LHPSANKFDFTLMRLQPKLSLVYVAVRNVVVVIDMHQFLTVHAFYFEHDVTVVCPLGDLPAFAVIDSSNVLYVHTTRPCRRAEELICVLRLNLQPGNSKQAHIAASASFHSSSLTLFVGDNLGYVSAWSLRDVIRGCKLTPLSFPSMTLSSTVLRRKLVFPPPEDNGLSVVLLWGPLEAHTDEVTTTRLVSNGLGATILMSACWGDHRVRFWASDGTPAGELSQGRLGAGDKLDRETVALQYKRHGVKPYLVPEVPVTSMPVELEDLPEIAVHVLKKAARRFYTRKLRALERKSFVGSRTSFVTQQHAAAARKTSFTDIQSAKSFVASTPPKRKKSVMVISDSASPTSEVTSSDASPQAVGLIVPARRPTMHISHEESDGDSSVDLDDLARPAPGLRASEWTVAKNLDIATGAVSAVAATATRKHVSTVALTPKGAAEPKFAGPAKPPKLRPSARLRSDHQVDASAIMVHYESAKYERPEALIASPARNDQNLTEATKLMDAERDRVKHERHIAERCHLHPECVDNLHSAEDAYRAVSRVAENLDKLGREELHRAARASRVPSLPSIASARSFNRQPHTARPAHGTTADRRAPVGTRQRELLAARSLFGDDPVSRPQPATSRSHSSVAAPSRASDAYSTSLFNAGSYSPMYRTSM
jgi:hypothetical protein